MSELSKFHVVLNAEGWEDYKKTLIESSATLAGLKIQTAPKAYPCLAAALVVSKKDVRFCFVYESDAMDLLAHSVADDDEFLVTIEDDELSIDGQNDAYVEDDYSDLDEVPKTKHKMEINPLVLGMLLELEAIGALKLKKTLEAMDHCSKYMHSILDTDKPPTYDTFEQFLDELRASYRAN
jgi:hypothetical protein